MPIWAINPNGMVQQHIGPVVKRMLEQSVQQTWQKEQQLSASFEEARQEAAKHSGDLVQLRMLEREVTRLEAQYDLLFEKISTVDMRQMQAPIQATVVREPVPDRVPVSPQIRFLVFICLASGTASRHESLSTCKTCSTTASLRRRN